MYGGLKGEDSNAEIFTFNPTTNAWLCMTFSNSSQQVLPRDDHVMSDTDENSFLVFGGFVNGSRVNEICKFGVSSSQTLEASVCEMTQTSDQCPLPRASSSSAFHNGKLYVFGG